MAIADSGAPTSFSLVLVSVGMIICLTAVSGRILKDRLLISEALFATAIGICFNPAVSTIVFPQEIVSSPVTQTIFLSLARVVLALQLMSTALDLPRTYVFSEWRSLAVMLGPVTVLMWVISSALALATNPSLGVWRSAVIGACLMPTDPVLSAAIIKGRLAEDCVPSSLRYLILGESGLNDGLAYPFVMLGNLFLTFPPGEAIARWFWEVRGGVFFFVLG